VPRTITVKLELSPWGRRVLFGAIDLLTEVENGDKALLPDSVVAAAERLRRSLDNIDLTDPDR
jgi:hypothetical protein